MQTTITSKLSICKIQKVETIASKLAIQPIWLFSVMYFETATTFSPSITNNIGSVGLIQFTADGKGKDYKTINGKKYRLSDIKKMTFEKQMDLVYEYYKPYIGKMNSFLDVYFVTFFPTAVGKNDDFVFQTKNLSASLIAKQNPIFDTNKDEKVTRKEVKTFFENYYGKQNFDVINFTLSYYTIVGIVAIAVSFFFS